ncbi:MAG: serine hydrolase [Verrucomicrobiales bacterium]
MNRRAFTMGSAVAGLRWAAAERTVVEVDSEPGRDAALDRALEGVAPELKKWASVCEVVRDPTGRPTFVWTDYQGTGRATDFWPASTIKVYAVVAALELLTERGFPLDTTATFEHREPNGRWVLDCARSMREMLSENFRRSSNEDYTLLLRLVGIDRLNTRFLIPGRGFRQSALMRGYVAARPWNYIREQPQRIRLRSADGVMSETHEHTWSGRSYSEERGGTVLDAKTGNVTTPRDLVECLRRILYHEELPESERYRLTAEQLRFLRGGGDGLTGLETRNEASGPIAWTMAAESIFPTARFYHKSGLISNFALEMAAIDASANGGPAYLLAPVIHAGSTTQPVNGEKLIGQMSLKIAEWARDRHAARMAAH